MRRLQLRSPDGRKSMYVCAGSSSSVLCCCWWIVYRPGPISPAHQPLIACTVDICSSTRGHTAKSWKLQAQEEFTLCACVQHPQSLIKLREIKKSLVAPTSSSERLFTDSIDWLSCVSGLWSLGATSSMIAEAASEVSETLLCHCCCCSTSVAVVVRWCGASTASLPLPVTGCCCCCCTTDCNWFCCCCCCCFCCWMMVAREEAVSSWLLAEWAARRAVPNFRSPPDANWCLALDTREVMSAMIAGVGVSVALE